jgi:preprotein translocase subunit SecE
MEILGITAATLSIFVAIIIIVAILYGVDL